MEEKTESSCIKISISQVAVNAVLGQFRDLDNKIGPTLQPVFVSRKLEKSSRRLL